MLPDCRKNDVPLFHITEKKNIPSIIKKGLLTSKMDLEAISELRYDFIRYDNPDYTMEQAREDVYPVVFAADKNGVENLSLLESFIDNPVVLGIKYGNECADQFYRTEMVSFDEFVSESDIAPQCLCIVRDWE